MRKVLALAAVSLLLLGAAAPHVHAGTLGEHGCVACVTATGEQAERATSDVAPLPVWTAELPSPTELPPVTGVAIGAIPGQSPPAR